MPPLIASETPALVDLNGDLEVPRPGQIRFLRPEALPLLAPSYEGTQFLWYAPLEPVGTGLGMAPVSCKRKEHRAYHPCVPPRL